MFRKIIEKIRKKITSEAFKKKLVERLIKIIKKKI